MAHGTARRDLDTLAREVFNRQMVRICFVCLGNICRSPTAEGVMGHLVDQAGLAASIEIDSSGTGAYHAGERADARARATATARGLRLDSIARRVRPDDFERFDYLLAMDTDNLSNLARMAPSEHARSKIHLLRNFDPASPRGASVPDPYYGGDRGFDEVFDICEAACKGLLHHLRQHHELT